MPLSCHHSHRGVSNPGCQRHMLANTIHFAAFIELVNILVVVQNAQPGGAALRTRQRCLPLQRDRFLLCGCAGCQCMGPSSPMCTTHSNRAPKPKGGQELPFDQRAARLDFPENFAIALRWTALSGGSTTPKTGRNSAPRPPSSSRRSCRSRQMPPTWSACAPLQWEKQSIVANAEAHLRLLP